MAHRLTGRLCWCLLALTGCVWLSWPLLAGDTATPPGRFLIGILVLSLALVAIPCSLVWRHEQQLQDLVALVQRHCLHPTAGGSNTRERRDPVGYLNRVLEQIRHEARVTQRHHQQEIAALYTGIEEMGHGFFITTAHGVVQYLSPKAQRYWGVPDDWITDTLRTPILFNTRKQMYDSWHKAVSSGHHVREVCQSADRRESLLVAHIPLDTTQTEQTWLTVQQDISEVSLMRLIRRDFIGNLSHELRNLLAKLQANAEIAVVARTDSDRDKYLHRLLATLQEMSHLQEGLMDLYLIETGLETVTPKTTHLPTFLTAVHDNLLASALNAGIRLRLDTGPDIRLPLDTQKITRVITNLVQNALKFTPAQGTIALGVHIGDLPLENDDFREGLPSSLSLAEQRRLQPGSVAIISVRDSGRGIPGPSIPRVFERLHQLDTSQASPGTGLGLSLARHTVRAHGGLIWACNNRPGPGITFNFSLPLQWETAREPVLVAPRIDG